MGKNKRRTQVNRREAKAHNVALTGIMMALSLVLLYLGSMLPAIESTFYIFGGIAIGIVIVEAGWKNGLLLYLGTLLLGLFIVPNKGSIVLYGCLFGIYSICKYYIEKIDKKLPQIGLKLAFILADCAVIWALFREILLPGVVMSPKTMVLGLAVVVIAFFVYDYIFTLCIYIYRKKFKRESMDISLSASNEPVDTSSRAATDFNLASNEPVDTSSRAATDFNLASNEPVDTKEERINND